MSKQNGPTRWGIVSCGKISHDFTVGMSTLDPNEHQVLGAAARNLDSAKNFAKDHDIPKAFGSYEELFNDPEIDVVYIGSVHTEHFRLSKEALEHGKNVLCEMPLTVTLEEAQELFEVARTKKRFLMEAVWPRFLPAYQQVKEELTKGTIGDVRQIVTDMGVNIMLFPGQEWRLDSQTAGGATLEFATFALQFVTLVFGGSVRPTKILAGGHLSDKGADMNASATLLYPGGKTATVMTHFEVNTPWESVAVGTKGTLKVPTAAPMFGAPMNVVTPEKTYEFVVPTCDKKCNYMTGVGLSYQCQEVRRCLQAGLLESPNLTWDEMLNIAEMVQSIRKQVGVSYPQDKD